MAGIDVRISELPAATEGHPDDRFETTQVDGATLVSRSITLEQVSDAVAAALPPPVSDWDSITGKPATFPPTVPIAYSDISGKPSTFPPDPEAVDDRVAALLVAGTNVTLNYNDPANTLTINASGGGTGTVTGTSVVSANGLAGTVATPTTTPAITLSTTVSGMLKGNGTAISAGVAGTNYVTPGGLPTSLPPNGAAGGDLSGTYPNPTIKPSVTDGQVLTTVAGVAAWAAAAGGAATSVGTTPPGSPTDGQLWYYSDAVNGGGQLYIRYNDGNSTQWVPAAPIPAPAPAISPIRSTKVTKFIASGTFTPDVNCVYGSVVGKAGGGAGSGFAGDTLTAQGGGGGAEGNTVTSYFTLAQVSPTVAVTIGAGGTGRAANSGLPGGDTIFGTLLTAKGGGGGPLGAGLPGGQPVTAGNIGDIVVLGIQGGMGQQQGYASVSTVIDGGNGGGSGGGTGGATNTVQNGQPAIANSGGGGGGPANNATAGNRTGGAGGSGNLYVIENLK